MRIPEEFMPASSRNPEPNQSVGDGDIVPGMPRMRLQRNKAPQGPALTPSSKLTGSRHGLWADVQRHHMQVYEYLCHVGEAKEWLEGCLNLPFEFDVLRLDDGLRNGVILARLVKRFTGDSIVKRIYEVRSLVPSGASTDLFHLQAPKLSFLHSDNINYFFVFVRAEGLPEVSIRFR